MIEELMSSRVLILGCGNTLFGDDGFGPAVVEALQKAASLPQGAAALDVGTSLSELLFDLALTPDKPERIVILDAVYMPDRSAGEVFELSLPEIPESKKADFSMHQFPAVNLLQELVSEGGVDVRVLAVQVAHIPDHVQPGLSSKVQAAIPAACHQVHSLLVD